MTSRGYLPPVSDNKDTPSLREQLEVLQAKDPDSSLADIIRRAIRFYVAAQKEQS